MITGERIFLRALEPMDYQSIHDWRIAPEVNEKLGGNKFNISLERDKRWTENKSLSEEKGIYWGICLKNSNEMIGYCSMSDIDLRNQKVHLSGIFIGEKNYHGLGYGKEACALMLRFFFDNYPINKCYTYVLDENEPSKKMFSKLGFIKEGVLRQNLYKNGEFKDVVLFSILKSEIKQNF